MIAEAIVKWLRRELKRFAFRCGYHSLTHAQRRAIHAPMGAIHLIFPEKLKLSTYKKFTN
jgi:hypothetical protein